MSTFYSLSEKVSGTATAADGDDIDKTLISAPADDKRIYVQSVHISVTVGGADSGGLASLEDGAGGTKFFSIDADAGTNQKNFSHNFGEPGYPLTAGNLLNLTVDGDGTTEATAQATVTGIII